MTVSCAISWMVSRDAHRFTRKHFQVYDLLQSNPAQFVHYVLTNLRPALQAAMVLCSSPGERAKE
jgi:hypothetical protein